MKITEFMDGKQFSHIFFNTKNDTPISVYKVTTFFHQKWPYREKTGKVLQISEILPENKNSSKIEILKMRFSEISKFSKKLKFSEKSKFFSKIFEKNPFFVW